MRSILLLLIGGMLAGCAASHNQVKKDAMRCAYLENEIELTPEKYTEPQKMEIAKEIRQLRLNISLTENEKVKGFIDPSRPMHEMIKKQGSRDPLWEETEEMELDRLERENQEGIERNNSIKKEIAIQMLYEKYGVMPLP
jgi:hypothetical protein